MDGEREWTQRVIERIAGNITPSIIGWDTHGKTGNKQGS